MRKNSIFVNKKRKLKKNKMGTFQGQCLVVLMRYDALLYILLQKPRKVCKIVDGYQKNMSQWSYSSDPYRTILPVQIKTFTRFLHYVHLTCTIYKCHDCLMKSSNINY